MDFLGLGTGELLLIVLVLLLLFGAAKLPELGRSIGSFGREVKSGMRGDEPEQPAKKSDTSKK